MRDIDLRGKSIIVTGAAGFIGANLVETLLRDIEDINIIGIDNMNDYYDVSLKEYRLQKIQEQLSLVSGKFKFTGCGSKSGSTGRSSLFYCESRCLYRIESERLL